MRAVTLALLASFAVANAAQANGAVERARSQLATAKAALERAEGRQARLSALGQATRAHELALSVLRDGLRRMAQREREISKGLKADQAQLEELIGALQSLSRAPRSAVLAYPGGPVEASRSAMLMAGLSPELNGRVDLLRARLDELLAIRTRQEVARIEARGALATLQDLRAQTAAAMKSRRVGRIATRSDLRVQAEAAAHRAQDLRDLAEILDLTLAPGAQPQTEFDEAKGTLALPVAGDVTAGYGNLDPWGRPGAGLTLSAPAFAEVISPWSGTVRFAGPLTLYGNVVVLEPQDGWMILLAGLASVDRTVGEVVLAGERLGDLGGPIPASDEFLLEGSAEGAQFPERMLYLEIRQGDRAVDPVPWFDQSGERIRG